MARVKLVLPKQMPFETEVKLRITDINYGGHLGNDAVLALIHEARMQFLGTYNYSETNIEGAGIIMTDSVIVYKNQGFYGDVVRIKVGVDDFSDYGFDIFYQLLNRETGKEVARAKTGVVLYDYEKQKIQKVPESLLTRLQPEQNLC